MKYYLEILEEKSEISFGKKRKLFVLISSTEFPTKTKAKSALAKKQIDTNQQKQVHLCTHDEKSRKPCEII